MVPDLGVLEHASCPNFLGSGGRALFRCISVVIVLCQQIPNEWTRHTSMYDTSTVKLTLGSLAFFCSTRTNNSEHVKGIIPLSGPSEMTELVNECNGTSLWRTYIPSYYPRARSTDFGRIHDAVWNVPIRFTRTYRGRCVNSSRLTSPGSHSPVCPS